MTPGSFHIAQVNLSLPLAVPVLGDDRLIVNLSVWESIEQPAAFVYRSAAGAPPRVRSRCRQARW
jgi:hypothetical protein